MWVGGEACGDALRFCWTDPGVSPINIHPLPPVELDQLLCEGHRRERPAASMQDRNGSEPTDSWLGVGGIPRRGVSVPVCKGEGGGLSSCVADQATNAARRD